VASVACFSLPVDSSEPTPPLEVELKFWVDDLRLARFLKLAEPHVAPEVHDAARPVAWARTTYLDTSSFDYFRSGADARHPRLRLRIREYAASRHLWEAPLLTGLCFLELKQSEAALRRKVRWCAPDALIRTLVASAGLVPPGVDAPAAIVRRLRLDHPTPVATTWYRRCSFVAPGVRITVDDPVLLCRPAHAGAPGLPAAPADVVDVLPRKVLEVKLTDGMPAWLQDAVRTLPAPRPVSKFALAVEAVRVTSGLGRTAGG
jgi:VTC domain